MKSKYLNRIGKLAALLALLVAIRSGPTAWAQAAAPATVKPAAPAAGMVRYDASPTGNKMKMAGTSSIHDWTMESVLLGGFIEADAKFPESALTDAKAARPSVSVYIPVRSFKSGNAVMDGRMQKEMKEPQFKRIEYKLIELKPKSAPGATGALQFDATGALTIAGKTLTNTMPVTIEKVDGTKLKVTGSTAVKMTDYGIERPSLIPGMGSFSTGDEVKLTFEWLTAVKAQ